MYKCALSRELPRTCCAVARHTKEREARREKRGRGTGRRTRHSKGKAEQDGERGTAAGKRNRTETEAPQGKRNRTENEARRAVRSQAETSTELPKGAQEARTRRRDATTKKDSGRSCRPLCLVRSCVPLSLWCLGWSCVPLSGCCALFGVAFRFPFAVPCSELRSAPPLFPARLPFLGVFALANAQQVRGSSRRGCCL